jgi:hypothetical protein
MTLLASLSPLTMFGRRRQHTDERLWASCPVCHRWFEAALVRPGWTRLQREALTLAVSADLARRCPEHALPEAV